jgi:AraC-like DNA-binding protein
MDWIQSLTRAINFMENNLLDDITVNDVADRVYASTANFQRVFHLATGITIGDYIRNRRLSLAGQDLRHPKGKIADIAAKYRYDTQESFSRAFSRFHGINPSDARKPLGALRYFHPLTINITIQGGFDMANSLELLTSAQHAAMESDTVADFLAGVEPTRTANKITDYRRISTWENYYLSSAICSVGESLGAGRGELRGFHFYAHITGDSFTYMYAAEKGNPDKIPCDSGVTNYFFMPHVVKKAYAAFGYDCVYISNSQIKKEYRAVMNAIKASVDRGIPVLAWGMGNVTMASNKLYNPLPEGCLIGGYDEGDVLYVNLYPNKDDPNRLPPGAVDGDGYVTITNGLETTNGLFFVGKKLDTVDNRQIHLDAIDSIPTFLTLPVFEGYMGGKYAFGKAAFDVWADTLETDEYFTDKTDRELGDVRWNLHNSPFCSLCTTHAYSFIEDTVKDFPDIEIAAKLLPSYKFIHDCKDAIWELHEGFEPPPEWFRRAEYRALLAKIIRGIGETCADILDIFDGKIKPTREIKGINDEVALLKEKIKEEIRREAEEAERRSRAKLTELKAKLNQNVADATLTEIENGYGTAEEYEGPILIRLRAKIDKYNLRIFYGNGMVIFNRFDHKKGKPNNKLFLRDISTNKAVEFDADGTIPENEPVDIEWFIGAEVMAVRVNGQYRHASDTYRYISDWKKNPPQPSSVRVIPIEGSSVTVESLKVIKL